jgi:hypothetical protein
MEMEPPLQAMREEQPSRTATLTAMDAAGITPQTIMTEQSHSGRGSAPSTMGASLLRVELIPLDREQVPLLRDDHRLTHRGRTRCGAETLRGPHGTSVVRPITHLRSTATFSGSRTTA